MRLRTRFVLILGAFTLALVAVAIGVAQVVVVRHAIWVERQAARSALDHGMQVLAEQQDILLRSTTDWATWDDAYAFITNRDPLFIQANLVDNTLSELQLDIIAFFDTEQKPVAVKTTKQDVHAGEVAVASLCPHLLGPGGILNRVAEQGRVAGFAILSNEVWLVAAAPILKSDSTGPSHGVCLMARKGTTALSERLTRHVHESARVLPSPSSPPGTTLIIDGPGTLIARTAVPDLCGQGSVVMELRLPRDFFADSVITVLCLAGWILASGVATTAFAFWVLDRWVLRKMTESTATVVQGIETIARSRGSRPRLQKPQSDEVSGLVQAINSMLDALESLQQEAMHAQKLSSLGTMAVGIAHEVNNPNGVISINATLLQKRLAQLPAELERLGCLTHGESQSVGMLEFRKDLDEAVAEILTASRRIAEFVASLKRFAAPSADEKVENLDINDAVRAAARWVTHEIKVRECRLEWKLADELPPVRGSIRRLEQVFVNLLQNAAHAALRPGTLIEVTTTFDRRAQTVVVCIRDEGKGIPAEDTDRIFDPFFTTRREDGGSGLGLSISQTIVRAHGGSLRLESEPGQGTRAIVSLPMKGEVSDVG